MCQWPRRTPIAGPQCFLWFLPHLLFSVGSAWQANLLQWHPCLRYNNNQKKWYLHVPSQFSSSFSHVLLLLLGKSTDPNINIVTNISNTMSYKVNAPDCRIWRISNTTSKELSSLSTTQKRVVTVIPFKYGSWQPCHKHPIQRVGFRSDCYCQSSHKMPDVGPFSK